MAVGYVRSLVVTVAQRRSPTAVKQAPPKTIHKVANIDKVTNTHPNPCHLIK